MKGRFAPNLFAMVGLWLALACPASLAAPQASSATGAWRVSLAPRADADGRHALLGLAATRPAPAVAARFAHEPWQLRMFDASGRPVVVVAVANPVPPLLGSRDPSQPLQLRFNDVPDAVRVDVHDDGGRLRAVVRLDAGARVAAELQRRRHLSRTNEAGRPSARRADPPAFAAEARRQLERQLEVEQQQRHRREAGCDRRARAWFAPEIVRPDPGCAPANAQAQDLLGTPAGGQAPWSDGAAAARPAGASRRALSADPLPAHRPLDFPAPPGVQFTGRVSVEGGPLPPSYEVIVTDLRERTTRRYLRSGPDFTVTLAPGNPAKVEIAEPTHYPVPALAVAADADAGADFVMTPLARGSYVSLVLTEPGGQPLSEAQLEVWRDGHHVTGAFADESGFIELHLAPGDYELKVWPDSEHANQWSWERTRLFAEPALRRSLAVASGGDYTLQMQVAAADWKSMRLFFPADANWPGCDGLPHGRLELLRDGQVVARGPFRELFPGAGGRHELVTGPGRYSLRLRLAGEVAWTSDVFTAADGLDIRFRRDGEAPRKRWTGTLRSPDGTPVAHRDITVSDELGIITWPSCPVRSAADGRFDLPLCQGCVYEFQGLASEPGQRRIVHFDEPVPGHLERDVVLMPPLPFQPLAETGVSRVYGHPDAPFRLIFLPEGYAAERETFTDSNGNGVWDGVQFVDRNGNGVWDLGEPYATYGSASPPRAGQDPRPRNEVFQDRNGDGVLSLDDKALFERNIHDYLRALFSSDQFSQYRHAYQAMAVMNWSPQVGMDDGAVQRNTLYGVNYRVDRDLVSIDYDAASQAAEDALPGHTAVVLMINMPVPYGRVNSFVLATGGPKAGNINDALAVTETDVAAQVPTTGKQVGG